MTDDALNFLNKIKVVSDEDLAKEPYTFIGSPVDTSRGPYVPSITHHCDTCDTALWISKTVVRQACLAQKIICPACAIAEQNAREEAI